MIKILDYMNIYKYEYLFTSKKQKETFIKKSNIFAYYILKTISIFNYEFFNIL